MCIRDRLRTVREVARRLRPGAPFIVAHHSFPLERRDAWLARNAAFVVAAGASNGAARSCGASEPDLAQHQATSRKNLERYAKEYGFSAAGYDGLYEKGLGDGTRMMEEMKRSGVDGCRGVLGLSLIHI